MDRPIESTSNSTEPRSADPTVSLESAWWFIGYILLLYFIDFLGFAAVENSMARSEFLMVSLIGVVYGQIALAIIVAGLLGDNWLEGIFLSVAAILGGLIAGSVGAGFEVDPRSLPYLATIPLICLAAASPLILMRWIVGWRLCPQTTIIPPRSRLTIEAMILVPASFVGFCVMAFAPNNLDQSDFIWSTTGLFQLFMSGFSLIVILPCTYWAFRTQDAGLRWVVCIGYPFMLMIVAIIVISTFAGQFPAEAIGWSIFITLISSSVAMLGLQLLYSNGYRLTNFAHAAASHTTQASADTEPPASEVSPFDLEPLAQQPQPLVDPLISTSRKRHRIAVAALLISTAIVNTGLSIYSQTSLKRTLDQIVAAGGSVVMSNGKPIEIRFGPWHSSREIAELPPMPSVKLISVAGSNIVQAYFLNKFSSLETLDIRKTGLRAHDIRINRPIEVLVNEGQFSSSELKEFTNHGFGMTVKEIPSAESP